MREIIVEEVYSRPVRTYGGDVEVVTVMLRVDGKLIAMSIGDKHKSKPEPSPTDLVFGLQPRTPMPEGSQAVEAITIVSYLNADGEVCLHLTGTPDLPSWTALGMMTAASDQYREQLKEAFEPTDEDDND
jgi:hypothetical protein